MAAFIVAIFFDQELILIKTQPYEESKFNLNQRF
jgi:hypothetical protein